MEDVQRIYKRVSVIHVMRYDNVAPQAVSCSCAIASQPRDAVSWEVRLLHCLVELIASNVSIPVADSVVSRYVPGAGDESLSIDVSRCVPVSHFLLVNISFLSRVLISIWLYKLAKIFYRSSNPRVTFQFLVIKLIEFLQFLFYGLLIFSLFMSYIFLFFFIPVILVKL